MRVEALPIIQLILLMDFNLHTYFSRRYNVTDFFIRTYIDTENFTSKRKIRFKMKKIIMLVFRKTFSARSFSVRSFKIEGQCHHRLL